MTGSEALALSTPLAHVALHPQAAATATMSRSKDPVKSVHWG